MRFRKGAVRVKTHIFVMAFGLMLCQCGGKTAVADEPNRDLNDIEEGVFDENGNRIEEGMEAGEEDGQTTEKAIPVTDRDGDGILENEDQCPDDPEDLDNFKDEDGCPDHSKVVVISCPGPQPIPTFVYYNKKTQKILKQDYAILDAVVEVINNGD